MHRVLADTQANIAARLSYLDAVIAPMSEDRLKWRPSANRWSILEVLAHLSILADVYIPALRKAIDKGVARGKTGPDDIVIHEGMLGGFLRKAVVSSKPVKAPGSFKPAPSSALEKTKTIDHFRAAHQSLAELAAKAEGLHVNKVRLRNPVLPLFTQTMGVTFEIIHLHLNRHFDQIDQLIAAKEEHSQKSSHVG